jgi:hypothetical protein
MTFIEKLQNIDEHRKALYFSLFLVTVAGIFPSLYSNDWVWFSRSGSLLVVYGVYIVWLDYQGVIDNVLIKITNITKKNLMNNNLRNY